MKISKKRILSVLAATALSISAVPQNMISMKPVLTACAEAEAETNLAYSVNADGTSVTITQWTGSSSEVVIPEKIEGLSVTAIGSQAFLKNKTLVSIELPDTVTEIGFMAFSQCNNLKSVKMPESLKTIGTTAFGNCSALEEIDLPNGVISIGNGAFSSCTNLETVKIPETVTSIGESAFRDTAWLTAKRNDNPLVIVNNILIDGATCSGDVVFPDNVTVTYINNQAFYGNETMTSITLPDTVTFIGNQAFMRCSALESILIPDSVTEIGSSLFNDCSELKYVELSDGLTTLNTGLFTGCSSLTSVKLPAHLTRIPAGLFQNCANLKDIIIPETVEVIDMVAFMNCTGLESIVLPKNLTSLGMYAFRSCTSLKSVAFKNSTTTFSPQLPFSMCSDVIFCGYAGSNAETYAKNNDYPFIAITSEFSNVSLTLNDDLSLNFFAANVNEDNKDDYKVVFTGKCEENGEDTAFTEKAGMYCASANVSADHMGEEITASLYQKNGEDWLKIDTCTYSVNQYLENATPDGSWSADKKTAFTNLVTAAKNYGATSKAYFSNGAVAAVTDEQINEVIANNYISSFTTEAKLSLVLDSKLAARIYIKDKDVAPGASAECNKYISNDSPWYNITAKAGGKAGVYFEITDLAPTDLNMVYRVVYGGSEYNFTPLSWARRVMTNPSSSDKNKAMAYALYEYYVTADTFAHS